MKVVTSLIGGFAIWLFTLIALPTNSLSVGIDVVGKGAVCSAPSMTITGEFTAAGASYAAGGNCTSFRTGSLETSITFQWTGRGTYSQNTAVERIVVLPAPLSQASHPYGEWQTIYSCPSDPWLTGVTCKVVSALDDSAENAKALQAQFDFLRSQRPVTAAITQAQRDALLTKRDSDLKAIAKIEAEQRRGAEIRQTTPQQITVGWILPPTILAPSTAQQLYPQRPIPIRLAPPQGAIAESYVINLEIRDAKNNWIPAWNVGVPAAEAHSAAGFRGFGPDSGAMVGKFPSRPGIWRLNAQIASPRPSPWSDWVPFAVISLPTTNPAGRLTK